MCIHTLVSGFFLIGCYCDNYTSIVPLRRCCKSVFFLSVVRVNKKERHNTVPMSAVHSPHIGIGYCQTRKHTGIVNVSMLPMVTVFDIEVLSYSGGVWSRMVAVAKFSPQPVQ